MLQSRWLERWRSELPLVASLVALGSVMNAAGGPPLICQEIQIGDAKSLPAPSTIGQVLLRHGLIDPAESGKHQAFVRFEKEHPNELWQMDFKGHVPQSDGARCHPLTVLDDHSRFLLCLRACLDETMQTVKRILIELFERTGEP